MRRMIRIPAIFVLLIVLLLQLLLHADHVEAGILSKLVQLGKEAGNTGKNRLNERPDFISELNTLPYEAGIVRLSVDVAPDGSLNLLAEEGQSWPVRSIEDYRHLKSRIIKNRVDPEGKKTGEIRLYVTEHQLFDPAGNELLKKIDGLHLIRKNLQLPIKWVENQQPYWLVSINDKLELALTSPAALNEGLWRLGKGINLANMRLVSFSSDYQGLPSSSQMGLENSLPELTVINPATLQASFSALRHQTLVITGKSVTDGLEVNTGSGKVLKLALSELKAEAIKQDINLVVLETSTPAQLGAQSLPWNKQVRSTELEQAFSAKTYGEFLTAFGQYDKPLSLHFDGVHDNFTSFRTLPAHPAPGNYIGTEVLAHSLFHALKIQARSEAYQQELDRRIITFIPSWVHAVYILNIIFGFLASTTSIRIWRKFLPLKNRNDDSSWLSFTFNRIGRIILFIFIFLGLFGGLFLIYSVLHGLYTFISTVLMILCWPVRYLISKQA